MIRQHSAPWLATASLFLLAAPLSSEEAPKKDEKKPAASIHEVKAERFRSAVKLNATFESTALKEITVDPEEWKTLTVTRAVANGERVQKGDVILAFDTTDLEEKIAELEAGKQAAQLTLQQKIDEHRHLEQSTPLQLMAAEEKRAHAEEALAYFEEVQLEQSQESAKRSLEFAEFSLEYSQEELNQLEKMYEEDNLTEETEEIILKRTRRSVKAAKQSVARTRLATERTLKVELPRRHQALKADAKKTVLDHELGRVTLPRALEIKTSELEKARREHRKSREALSKMKNDLDKMTVKAQMDGYVFYGPYVDGKWARARELAKKLIPGGTVGAKERILTIAKADGLRLRATVPENQFGLLQKGMKGSGVPVAFPGERLTVRITSLSTIPVDGGFTAEMTVKPNLDRLKPGMTARVTFVPFKKDNVLTVPSNAVHEDENGTFVTLANADPGNERRVVSVGFSDGNKTVIEEGLEAGDKVRSE